MIHTTTFEVDCIEDDLIGFLAAQPFYPKFYLKSKDSKEERVAFGSLLTFLQMPLLQDPSLCFYGAVSFPKIPSLQQDLLWKDFPSSFFFLPLYEIRRSPDGSTTLTYRSLQKVTEKNILSSLKKGIQLPSTPSLQNRVDSSSKESWVESLQSIFIDETVKKLVVARKSSFQLSQGTPLFSWLQRLLLICPKTETYALQTTPHSLFLGSSPERLFQRKNRFFSTEAIAGTLPRGKNTEMDLLLEKKLQEDAKCQKELEYVSVFLQGCLSRFCAKTSIRTAAHLVKTDTVQHLAQLFSGTLLAEISDRKLLETLHPTPAIGGFPTKESLLSLPLVEPFTRGLYAGVVGWHSVENSSFTVAIRSAIVQENGLHAFAGAGIVRESVPELEWEELEHKIQHWI